MVRTKIQPVQRHLIFGQQQAQFGMDRLEILAAKVSSPQSGLVRHDDQARPGLLEPGQRGAHPRAAMSVPPET